MRAIAEIGGAEPRSAQRFSLREAARILEVPEARLRALARAGFLASQRGPIGPLSFGFQDLLLLRTTKGLLESGVPMRRIRRIWASLRGQLTAGLPLTSISIHTDGEEVVASDGSARWRPDTGQFLLNFDASEIAERAASTGGYGRLRIVEGADGASPPEGTPGSGAARLERVRIVGGEETAPTIGRRLRSPPRNGTRRAANSRARPPRRRAMPTGARSSWTPAWPTRT